MYDLAKKQSKSKIQESSGQTQQQQPIPTQLVNLLQQAMRRQQEYLSIIESLKEQKETQAKMYVEKLEQFSKHLEEFQRKKQERQDRKEFKSFQMRHQEEAMRRQRRTTGKKEYTVDDFESFSLEIEIKFLFFNPIMEDPLSSYYPKRLEIRFNSLGLQFMSGKIEYAQDQSQHRRLLNDKYPLVLQPSAGNKNVCFQFSLTPSKKLNVNNLTQLMKLIKVQLLEIEVFDYDSQILFGVSYVSLEQLLFYDKHEDYWVDEAILFSPLRSKDVGRIDIQFRNFKAAVGDFPLIKTIPPQHLAQPSGLQSSKLKVTSNTPLDIDSPDYDIRSVQQKQRRLLRRINQHKEQNIKLGKSRIVNFQFDYMNNEVNKRKLDHIIKMKEENKFSFSEEILSRIHQEFQSYECSIGNVLVVPLVFCNNFDERITFQLVGSESMKQAKHVAVVTNSGDYEFYKKDRRIAGQPVRFTSPELDFSLAPSETVFILVKYLTYIHIPERSLELHVTNTHNSDIVHTFVFSIKSTPSIVDHRFRVFEGDGKLTELFIPYNGDGSQEQQAETHLYCQESRLQYAWGMNGFSIRVPTIKNQDIIVYLYDSKECRKLLKCYEIVIKKFIVVQFNNYQLGLEKTVQLQIPSSEQLNQVKFFSSDSQKLWTDLSYNKVVKIKPNSIETVTVTTRTLYYHDQSIILSCNKASGEIHCQWLFKLRVSKPAFKATFEVIASTTKRTGYTLEIQNPSQKTQAMGIVSNNLSYIQVEENKKVVNGGKVVFVNLLINPHKEEHDKEVIINVSNFDQSVNLNYLVRLRFSRQYKEKQDRVDEIVYRRY